MSESSPSVTSWVRHLIARGRDEPPRYPSAGGARRVTSGLRALIEAESMQGALVNSAIEGVEGVEGVGGVVGIADAGGAIAAGYGAAVAGQRVTVVAPADEIGPIIDRLRRAVERQVPLVLYLVTNGLGVIETLTTTGAPVAVATDPMHAIDLGLVARRLAEQTLVPVVVVLECDEVADAIQDLRLPQPGLIEDYLGRPEDRVASPTPAQRTLFGAERRRVPRWFDPGRPTARGQRLGHPEDAAAAVGREVFFRAHLPSTLARNIEEFRELTGRETAEVSKRGARRPRHWLVVRGGATRVASAVVEEDRSRRRARFGVMGFHWFVGSDPARCIDGVADGVDSLTVIERGATSGSGWTSTVSAACRRRGLRCVTATYRRLDSAAIPTVLQNVLAGENGREHLELDVRPPSLATEFPRRRAMLDGLRRDYPVLERISAAPGDVPPTPAAGLRTIAFYVECVERPDSMIEEVAERLSRGEDEQIRGRIRRVERGLWELRFAFSSDNPPSHARDAAADLLLIGQMDQTVAENPLAGVAESGTVVIASALDPEQLGLSLPESWRAVAIARELKLYCRPNLTGAPIAATELVSVAEAFLSGNEVAVEMTLQAPSGDRSIPRGEIPLAVRRFGRSGESYDNVARFWSELIEPWICEPVTGAVPDPYIAAGGVPACGSSFGDARIGRETLPSIDAERCSGCGRCWESCPDSAIGAVALQTQALLDTISDGVDHPAEDVEIVSRLRRAHKQLAARLESGWKASGAAAVPGESWLVGFDWLIAKMGLDEQRAAQAAAVRDRMVARLEILPLSLCQQPASLLMLAINPRACQGCGICETVCPDGAVTRHAQTDRAVAELGRLWQVWESLPDTSGAVIAQASSSGRLSPLAAVLLSRDCSLAVTGRGSEPGSGERLAVRQVAAVVEYQLQRRVLEHAGELEGLERSLMDSIRESFGDAVEDGGPARLAARLDSIAEERVERTDIVAGLEGTVDVPAVRERVALCAAVADARRELIEGAHGLGRARYGVVLHGEVARDWVARFPLNPFSVPVTADLMRDGADVARGLASAGDADTLRHARLVRRAKLWIERPADLRERERLLDRLDRGDLTAEELATSVPVLLLADATALRREGGARLTDLLDSDLPVKLLILEEHDLVHRAADPLVDAIARRDAFVLSTSISTPAHLFEGVTAAIAHDGPAVIHIHAPSPRRHGFPTSQTIERAAGAVEARVQPLLQYDPHAAGVFGTRIDISANPDVGLTWIRDDEDRPLTPSRWAEAERRFNDPDFLPGARDPGQPAVPGPNGRDLVPGESFESADESVRDLWRTLQEWSGVRTPFTEKVEKRLTDQVRDQHQAELAKLHDSYREKLEMLTREQRENEAERLRRRLLQLAGHGEG